MRRTLSFLVPTCTTYKVCLLSKYHRLSEMHHSLFVDCLPLHLFSSSPNNPDHIKALASQCKVLDEIFTIYQKLAASHFLSYTEWIIREAFRSETSFLFLPSKYPSEKRKQQFSNIKKTLSDMLSVSGLPGLQISALPQLVLPVALTGVQAIPLCSCQCTNPLPPG